ncbi:membrane bound O-acyl transferase family-domain-containing protein [Pseudomassariella vexata]|uniref:Membrane bound O-acyl transferase family-domain-containing protein n=1 Tax=Pseudomassariella vexata TaxID=1141098 RepID=A0A1Y2E2P4_9PEZI|nr:membrane bound O-acyl transferase family-domain-containing protein [Pseudomassariella vexata]ORY65810.1 membrane bound O-acyl transferase family-domain-containing protein [Pseudomassariella vexata]
MTMTGPVGLATTYRHIYRTQAKEDILSGNKRPFLVPLCFLAYQVIPTLYLAIPHKKRPWLYRARWLILAFTTAFNIKMILEVSSLNFACSYGAGLIGAWGLIWNFTVLVWTRPQWDAKRVELVRNKFYSGIAGGVSDRSRTVHANRHVTDKMLGANADGESSATSTSLTPKANGQAPNGHASNGHANGGLRERQQRQKPVTSLHEANGHTLHANGSINAKAGDEFGETENAMRANMERVLERSDCRCDYLCQERTELELGASQEFVYDWQEYPEDAPFLTRLDWAFDIVSTLRMTGWNWAIPVLPPYKPMPLSRMSNHSRFGYTRHTNRRDLVTERLIFNIIPSYLIIDFCATLITQDPYFILGPNHNYPLPPYLASLPPALLSIERTTLGFISILSALQLSWNFGVLCLALLFPPILGFRAHPWHLPSFQGSFTAVLDYGLKGFWGTWWHQSFRVGFSAPTQWLVNRGYVKKGSSGHAAVGALVAFALSGFVHASGSYSTVPKTRPWEPCIFFLLSGVGAQVQAMCSRMLKRQIEGLPRWARRAGNFAFTAVWLHFSCGFLFDDFGRSALFLYEPVPFSVMRWMGLGTPGDRWWRYDRDTFPHWYTGKHWWQCGVGI